MPIEVVWRHFDHALDVVHDQLECLIELHHALQHKALRSLLRMLLVRLVVKFTQLYLYLRVRFQVEVVVGVGCFNHVVEADVLPTITNGLVAVEVAGFKGLTGTDKLRAKFRFLLFFLLFLFGHPILIVRDRKDAIRPVLVRLVDLQVLLAAVTNHSQLRLEGLLVARSHLGDLE